MRYTVRPISDRTWLGTMGKEPTRFKSKWPATQEILGREIDALQGRNVVIEIDITESDLKLNGELRANARPTTRAVVVAFESKHGPLLYRCDRFYTNWHSQGPEWQHNVRAIALTLEALRAVDRYGATETGQQYAGFKALPAGRAMGSSHMTASDARAVIQGFVDHAIEWDDADDVRTSLRAAKRAAHPDFNKGQRSGWDLVEQAAKVLGLL